MHRYTITWIVIFGVIALMFVQLPQMAAKQDAVLNTYSALVEVDALARKRFVEPIKDDRLVHGAIRGMMLQLDPYSGYISPQELPAFERRTQGNFIGVGVELGRRDGQLTIIAPLDGSPAALAGVLPGDVIIEVDGRDMKGLSVFDVEELLGGPPGSPVRLRVQQAGGHEPRDLTIIRGPVSIHTVRGFRRKQSGAWDYMIDPDHRIGYTRVSAFYNNTIHEFNAALRELRSQGMRGLIIDLRFDPGGLMYQAVAMVDRFVGTGLILSTVTRRRAVQEYDATEPGTISDVELAVLINGGSASSSEIVAGALQDQERAVIVGERSFGKGSVQHVIYLTGHKAAVKLTVAYYRLPNGRIIHRSALNAHQDSWGIKPDLEVVLTGDERKAILESRRAVDLPRPPVSDPIGSVGSPEGHNASNPTRQGEIIRDRQLHVALSALRTRIKNGSIDSTTATD